ncbi:peptidylprolyl isomerase [Marinicella litoralis]|uniref:peptidylprolyl isomerase n=1 Tax=Marinicella litoralis TaxID=644220 RepID=A0A4R6XXM0_9GAMM|nr:peptidylprolyl isomerase [Marinicella litoralis]TDR22433.1 peptidylprolyl isomerase [Marinicella litoralis]
MKLIICCLALLPLISGCQVKSNLIVEPIHDPSIATPSTVVANSSAEEWRELDAENTLYLTLSSGLVVIELLPDLAPEHVANTKALIRQGVFDGTQFYRVLDGFVAQGGPMFESAADMKPLSNGKYSVPEELTYTGELSDQYIPFDSSDGYADETGFIDGFAVGRDLSSGETWLLHCYGALGMGRANELDSGGTELYIVNGPAQRYLDRNVTVFGRVITGMEHIQALKRSVNLDGPVDLAGQNIIASIQMAADLSADDVLAIEVMDTRSDSFKQLLDARKNRSGEWFVHQHDYIDACGVPIPVRLQTAAH